MWKPGASPVFVSKTNYAIVGGTGESTVQGEVTNELIYEVLKSIQAQVAVFREDTEHIKPRLSSIEHRLGLVHTDMATQGLRLDRIESRLSRVENRLNFGDQPQ